MNRDLGFASLELPETWEDRTTFQFVSPPDEDLSVPMAAGRGGSSSGTRVTVVIARQPLGEGGKIADVVKAQETGFTQSLPGVTVNGRDPWTHPEYGEVPVLDIAFPVAQNMQVRQVHIYFGKGEDVITMTLSCAFSSYSRKQAELQKLFEEFRLA